jgi:NAD(P)-dependent dehydrogenase (short-subunit alcohol dehydrogenase family)
MRLRMTREPRSLANEVVAITGVARGIGHATARALSSRGGRVPSAISTAVPPPTAGEEGQ